MEEEEGGGKAPPSSRTSRSPFLHFFCACPNFCATKKKKNASNLRKTLPKRLLRRLLTCQASCQKALESDHPLLFCHVIA